jgi:AcrR family transcriptional regulator
MDEAIVRAGWLVLAEAGYEGLTFEAVAKAAGCSRPALYRRFAGKRDLVMALVETSAGALAPDLSDIADPRRQLVEHTAGFVAYLSLPGGGATMALAQARRADAGLDAALEASFGRDRAHYEAAIAKSVGGRLPPEHVRLLVEMLLGAVLFRVALRNTTMDRREIELLVDGALDAALAAARRQAGSALPGT